MAKDTIEIPFVRNGYSGVITLVPSKHTAMVVVDGARQWCGTYDGNDLADALMGIGPNEARYGEGHANEIWDPN